MGLEMISGPSRIIDSCGYFLFGEGNYVPTIGHPNLVPPKEKINLHVLSDILNQDFPGFAGYLMRLEDLYENVMQHADSFENLRMKHRGLDAKMNQTVKEHLMSRNGYLGIRKKLREEGHGWIKSEMMLLFRDVNQNVVNKYIRESEDLGYAFAADLSNQLLVDQRKLLGSVSEEMQEFNRLLYNRLRKTALSLKGQGIISRELGHGISKDVANYFDRTARLLPAFCPRLSGLNGVLSDQGMQGRYVTDDLQEFEMKF